MEALKSIILYIPKHITDIQAEGIAGLIETYVKPVVEEGIEGLGENSVRVEVVELKMFGENEVGTICQFELPKARE